MATLALTAAGSLAGSALLPSGLSVLGTTLSGAAIGQAIGGVAGNYIDEALFGSSGQSRVVEGARLSELHVMASTEGVVIPKLYGRARLGGQMIWATNLEEEIITNTQTSGGSKLGPPKSSTTKIDYLYFANFAVGLCEGEISRIGRIWADGKELDLSAFSYRIYKGTEDQTPDSLIEAKEGAGQAPAYRGLAYIVFEHMPLAQFGNRIPQLNFEVFRSVDNFSEQVKALTLIPGAGEFSYHPEEVTRKENGTTITENVHTRQGGSDWTVSLNDLQDSLPKAKSISLIVSWFGSDLRAGQCELKPKVENTEKQTSLNWFVAGETRQTADLVSQKEGRPAFGGTPSDQSIIAAIQDLKARNLNVTFYPFILMDIEEGNNLPDPYTGNSSQSVYPWRGRITCDPAPGITGTPDKTPNAANQVSNFVGNANINDFTISGETVTYSGPQEWSLRRMVLHYAHICLAAGGVDAFIISSELKGLTQIRDSVSRYPFVEALVQLAADVKTILGQETKVTYAADWSEYFGHQPQDGSNDVYFHLDPLWSSPNIDAIGIDVYWPLSDWRDGTSHLDYQSGVRSIYDLSYLKQKIISGEGYEWFYQSDTDRVSQNRTPITDGQNKPWVFRFKDIKSWWSNSHYNRPNGIEAQIPTAWQPQSKPIWFTELGCPAVDKGSNQPNVFYDPKSSESFFPYFSSRTRDDTIQRRYIQAFQEFYNPDHEDYITDSNPVSNIYNDHMVDLDQMFIYSWDARPYPAFPLNSSVWADAINWVYGHWITGRIGDAPLAQTVRQILNDYGFTSFEVSKLYGSLQGFVIDRIMSARDALQPLELAFFMDSYETGGQIKFRHRGDDAIVKTITAKELVETSPQSGLYEIKRKQETELAAIAKLSYINPDQDYAQATAEARRLTVHSERVATAQLPLAMTPYHMQSSSEIWLHEIWASREQSKLELPPSDLAIEPTDLIQLETSGQNKIFRITETSDQNKRQLIGLSIEPAIYNAIRTPARAVGLETPSSFGKTTAYFMDLPLIAEDDNPASGYIAATQSPWPGGVAIYQSPEQTGYSLNTVISAPATLGVSLTDFSSGPTSRWDNGNHLDVQLETGTLTSLTESAVLNGENLAAIETTTNKWEVFQFQNAELIADKTYRLTNFLRGQKGTELYIGDPTLSGARFVLLDQSVEQVSINENDINLPYYWTYGPANKTIGHESYTTIQQDFSGLGYKPLSPVHVMSKYIGNDLEITWIRRTRSGGDNWETPEVPLQETQERYDIEILEGSNVKRLLTSQTPSVIYTQADQISDWGALQSSYTIRIMQLSEHVGQGHPAQAVIGASP